MSDKCFHKHILDKLAVDGSAGILQSQLPPQGPVIVQGMLGYDAFGNKMYDNVTSSCTNTMSAPSAGTGIKHDQDKADMSLLSNTALLKVAQVMTFGKKKYSAHNWRGGFIWSRPLAASLRHVFAYLGGEDKDPETGISHLAHAVCCLMFVLEFEDTHKELDDRFKGSAK